MKGLEASAVRGEEGFEVQDRGCVEGFEVADVDTRAVDGEDVHVMQADRVGPVGRTRGEDAGARAGGVVTLVDGEGVAVGAVEPGEQEYVGAWRQAFQRGGVPVVEDEPGV